MTSDTMMERATDHVAPAHAKFTITAARSALREAVTKLASLIPTSKPTLPILACLRLDVLMTVDELAADTGMQRVTLATLYGTNLDAAISLKVPVQAVGAGRAAIPARRLADILANLPAAAVVTIEVDGERIHVSAGRAKFDIAGMKPDEFPELPVVKEGAEFTVDAAAFISAITRVSKLASSEDSRMNMNSVCLSVVGDSLIAVSTDSYGLARVRIGDAPGGAFRPALIRKEAVPNIARLFGGLAAATALVIRSDGTRLNVTSKYATAVLALLDLEFPKYEPLIPKTWTHSIVCDREELASALRRVSIMSANEVRSIRLTFGADGRPELLLNSRKTDAGSAEDVVALDDHSVSDSSAAAEDVSEDLAIGAQSSVLVAALDALACERVRVNVEAPTRFIVIRDEDRDATDPSLALVAPTHLVD